MFDPTLKRAMLDGIVADMQDRSKSVEYRDDPVRWSQDVLGITLWSKQKEILDSVVHHKKTAVKSCHSIGKDLPVTTPIPTPFGWVKMGDLLVGDKVFGADGKPTTVRWVSPDMHTINYELTFNDGSIVVAGADHQWNTLDMVARSRVMSRGCNVDWREHWDESITRTTQQIVDTIRTDIGQVNHLVPVAAPVEYPEVSGQPLEPYVLGAWLGDGAKGGAYIYAAEDGRHILDKFRAFGYSVTKLASDPYGWKFSKGYGHVMGVLHTLKVHNHKHIPISYLRASYEQRLDLLHGLMDTDGFCLATGGAGIDLANEELAQNFAEMIRSLGVKANVRVGTMSVSGRIVSGNRYRIAFYPQFNPFSEGGHKHENYVVPNRSRTTARTIKEFRVVPTVTSRCISVDNADSLYLATENFIPTHNTFISAVAVCWWISTRPNSMVRSTAPTSYQVHELLWEEIRKLHAQHNLIGDVNLKDEWKRDLYGARVLVGSGKKPSDTNIHAFHGVHRPDGVLTVLDEGCGVPQTLYTAADAISTGDWDRVLAVGNPDDPETEFGRIFAAKNPVWNLLSVSAFDTPNFTGEPIPEIVSRGLIQPDWVEQRKSEWGEDSSRYKSKILAEFPDQSDDAFFKQAVIDRAYDTEITDELKVPGILGVDVASSGGDHSVIALNQGGKARIVEKWNHSDIVQSIDTIFDVAKRHGVREIRLDSVGYGEAVSQQMQHDPRLADYVFIPVKGSYAARDRAAHKNARAEQFDNLRLQMSQGKIDLDRTDEKLFDQLLGIKGFINAVGQIQIESKEDMRARGVKSPDELDAVVYACADFDYLFNKPLPTGTKIYEDLDSILGGNNAILDLMGSF